MFKKRVLPVLLSLALTATAALPVVYAVESSGEAEAVQPVPQTVNFTNAGPFLPVTLAEKPSDGLELSKTVESNGEGGYTINLEAYTTGTVTSVDTTKPVDIVLVLDVSGSMDYCINCGNQSSQHGRDGSCNNGYYEYTYEPVYDISKSDKYYYYDGTKYQRVYYCSGSYHILYDCDGGWFTQEHGVQGHDGTELFPRTSSSDTKGTQFYREVRTEVGGTKFESRIEALKNAVNTFVSNVEKSAAGSDGELGTDDDVEHRISIVKFSGEIERDWSNKLVVGNNTYTDWSRNTWNYSQPMTDLLDMTVRRNVDQITSAVEDIEPNGGTRSDYGMQVASEIMREARSEKDYDRNQVAIMFTDGVPTTSSEFSDQVANGAISAAAEIKEYNKATVYTVGVFDGADGTVPNSPDDMDSDEYDETNRYMHLVSSNFPDATGYSHTTGGWSPKDQWGELNTSLEDGESYYLSASDSESLTNIFETISDNISSSTVDLGAESVVRDVVTPQFLMPQNADDIHVSIMDAQYNNDGLTWIDSSYSTDGIEVTIDVGSRAVNVTGFDFEHNFVAENGRDENNPKEDGNFHGRKLVISFDVTVTPGFFGGNDVLTNGSGSGVYENAEDPNAFKEFDYPKVNIPIQYKVPNTEEQIFSGETPDLSGKSIDYAEESEPDGFNNKYVKITYELIDPAGKTVGIFEIPAGETNGTWTQEPNVDPLYEDTTYTIKCTVSPISDGQGADVGKPVTDTTIDNATHVVTVLNGTLEITKEMAQGTNADSGERFVFNIYKDNMDNPYMTVAVEAGKSVIINNLPAGTYTVKEDTSWSWRFESQLTDNGTVTINAKNPKADVTCTNSRENEQWLNKYDWAVNHQKGGGYVENTGRSEAQ
ncbi:MAG: VWA domain-containing protein [Clostridia bacterium]